MGEACIRLVVVVNELFDEPAVAGVGLLGQGAEEFVRRVIQREGAAGAFAGAGHLGRFLGRVRRALRGRSSVAIAWTVGPGVPAWRCRV